MTQHWHVAFTDSRAEQDTCAEIRDIGFEAYCPVERRKKFRNGKKIIIQTALFPRYLFARFDAEDPHWAEILEIDGVCNVLTNDGKPSPVKCGVVEKLKRFEDRGMFDFTQRPNPYPPGTIVALDDNDGPFSELNGLIGKVLRVRTRDRVDLLICYLQKEMTINVPMARLSHI